MRQLDCRWPFAWFRDVCAVHILPPILKQCWLQIEATIKVSRSYSGSVALPSEMSIRSEKTNKLSNCQMHFTLTRAYITCNCTGSILGRLRRDTKHKAVDTKPWIILVGLVETLTTLHYTRLTCFNSVGRRLVLLPAVAACHGKGSQKQMICPGFSVGSAEFQPTCSHLVENLLQSSQIPSLAPMCELQGVVCSASIASK